MTKTLICPKCLRSYPFTDNAEAWCEHDRPSGRFNPPVRMIPIEQLTEKVDA